MRWVTDDAGRRWAAERVGRTSGLIPVKKKKGHFPEPQDIVRFSCESHKMNAFAKSQPRPDCSSNSRIPNSEPFSTSPPKPRSTCNKTVNLAESVTLLPMRQELWRTAQV